MSNEYCEDVPLAPEATPLPDGDRTRLEALLRDLLRDQSLRALLCREQAEGAQAAGG